MSLNHFHSSIVISHVPTPNDLSKLFGWEYEMVYNRDGLPSLEGISIKDDYIPQPKDRLYFFKGCDCPRFKVRPWAAAQDASVTIRPDLATVFFVAKDSVLKSTTKNLINVKIPKLTFMRWLDQNYQLGDGNISRLYEEVSSCPADYVYLESEYASYSGRNVTGYNYNSVSGDVYDSGYTVPLMGIPGVDCTFSKVSVDDKGWEQLQYLYTNSNIYSQNTLIKQINAGASIIDEKLYGELRTMFESEDQNNHPMALEIMGSCNLDKSLYHLIKLLREFGSKIYNMKEASHVNFVSLLEVMGLEGHYTSISDDHMIECLIKHNQLTSDIVRPIAEDLKKQWKEQVDGKYFQISKIIVADVVKEALILEHKRKQQLLN